MSSPSRRQFIASVHSTQARRFPMCKSHRLKQKLRSQSLNNSINDFIECVSPAFSLAQLTSTDPQPSTIKKNRNLWQITFVRTENEQSKYQTWPLRLFLCICLRNSAFSRPIWRISASRPECLRICILSQFLAHQKISSSPTEKKTPRNPHSIACIGPNSPLASSLSFFFRLRRMDRSFLLGKKK
jgi:hypothetical protein